MNDWVLPGFVGFVILTGYVMVNLERIAERASQPPAEKPEDQAPEEPAREEDNGSS